MVRQRLTLPKAQKTAFDHSLECRHTDYHHIDDQDGPQDMMMVIIQIMNMDNNYGDQSISDNFTSALECLKGSLNHSIRPTP